MATALKGHSGPHPHVYEGGPREPIMSSVAKSGKDSAHIFRFFDLPRELRDKVYEQPVLMEQWHTHTIMLLDRDRYTQGEKLNTCLLLVSRQFRDEYTERCLDQQTLCLRDCLDFSDVIGVLNVLDELRSWVLDICTTESFAQPMAPRMLENYLGKCARWYHNLHAVKMGLYFNYQSDLDDCAPYVLDHMRSTLADIASFEKVAKLEIYTIKPTRCHKTASWSRKLLAQWRRDEPEATILLDSAPYTEGSEWEEFEGFTRVVDRFSSASSSSGPCSDDEDGGDDQGDDTDDDQDRDVEFGESVSLYEELLGQKGYGSADKSDNDVGTDIDSLGIDSDEHDGRVAEKDTLHSDHANNTSSHFNFFNLLVRSASPIDSVLSRIFHDTEALIFGIDAPTLTPRLPPQDYTREMRLLRIICLEVLTVLVFVLVCGVSDMVFSSR